MALQNFLRRFGAWTTVLKWQEPWLYRVRLKRDLLLRLMVAFGIGAVATCLLLVLFAINVNPPPAAGALFGMLVVGGVACLLLLHGSGTAGGSVRICQEGIARKRHYAGLSAQWMEDASWPYDALEQCVIVPGQAIGQSFSLLFLGSGGEFEIIGVPRRIELPQLAQFLSAQGLNVQHASYVPQQYTRPLNLPLALLSGAVGCLLLVAGLGFYLVKLAPWQQQDRPVAARPAHAFDIPAPPRFDAAPAPFDASPAPNAAQASPLPVTPAARNIPAVPAAIPAAPASPAPLISQPARSPGQRTQLVGGSGGFAFEATHPQQQAAIGFRYALGNWAGTEGLSQLQPLYASEPDAPNQVVARDGYIVAGLEVDADQFVEAVRILFARQTADGRIDPGDTYQSPWLGTPSDRTPQKLPASPAPIIGIHGRRGALIDALGLIAAPSGQP